MSDSPTDTDVARTLGLGRSPRRRRGWLIGLTLAGAGALVLANLNGSEPAAPAWKTAEVGRGGLTVTVTATGTLAPVNQVEVGSELSGTLAEVTIDYNDRVERGQVLARLDTEILQARLGQARASLMAAEARVREAEATLLEARLNFGRCQELAARDMCSKHDLDTARAAATRAEAAVAIAKAQATQARAAVDADETNLRKAVIRSPINGVVLDRKVEPGQTVAASFQTPVLFTLAEDLTRMQLVVAVDEADIGKVQLGQSAGFSVDAWPDRDFPARVTQIRHAPRTVEGVVTYETVLTVDNPEQRLLPGMTATAEIVVQQLDDALLVPNAALRFRPPETATAARSGGLVGGLFARPPRTRSEPEPAAGEAAKLWVLRDGQPVALTVTVGASDGLHTVVTAGELRPGMPVITDTLSTER